MKPEYIGVGNFDEDRYVYALCDCPVTEGWAIKFNKILDGKPHRYSCVCENCGTEVGVYAKSYGKEILTVKHDLDTGTPDNTGNNDPDGSAVEVES